MILVPSHLFREAIALAQEAVVPTFRDSDTDALPACVRHLTRWWNDVALFTDNPAEATLFQVWERDRLTDDEYLLREPTYPPQRSRRGLLPTSCAHVGLYVLTFGFIRKTGPATPDHWPLYEFVNLDGTIAYSVGLEDDTGVWHLTAMAHESLQRIPFERVPLR